MWNTRLCIFHIKTIIQTSIVANLRQFNKRFEICAGRGPTTGILLTQSSAWQSVWLGCCVAFSYCKRIWVPSGKSYIVCKKVRMEWIWYALPFVKVERRNNVFRLGSEFWTLRNEACKLGNTSIKVSHEKGTLAPIENRPSPMCTSLKGLCVWLLCILQWWLESCLQPIYTFYLCSYTS